MQLNDCLFIYVPERKGIGHRGPKFASSPVLQLRATCPINFKRFSNERKLLITQFARQEFPWIFYRPPVFPRGVEWQIEKGWERMRARPVTMGWWLRRSRGQTMLARLCRKKKKKRGTSEHFIKILLRRLKEGKKKTSIINPCFIISLQLSIKDRLLEISLLLSYLYIGITYIYTWLKDRTLWFYVLLSWREEEKNKEINSSFCFHRSGKNGAVESLHRWSRERERIVIFQEVGSQVEKVF